MTRLIQSLRKHSKKLILATAAAGALCIPTMAMAADRGRFDRGNDRPARFDHDHDRGPDVRFGIRISDPDFCEPGPVYQTRTERIWVEPVYRTVCDRIWREPVTREECVRVWVEPVSRMREVVHYEYGRKVVTYERVPISEGHWTEQRTRVVIREGHWENIERRELVCAGHFEERAVQVRVEPRPIRPTWNFSFLFGR